MCLIGFAWRRHPRFPLVLAANRDEFHARETAAAGFWPRHPQVLGGRDLKAGGTWMGITRTGRFAALSNYRGGSGATAACSRGALVRDFLLGTEPPAAYAASAAAAGASYGGFNLLAGDLDKGTLHYVSNRGAGPQPVAPGVHAVSNALLDTPWPKVGRLNAALEAGLGDDTEALCARLFTVLLDTRAAADEDLPDTGIGRDRERFLSSPFIVGDRYGTRASTVLLVDAGGAVTFVEKSFGPNGHAMGEQRFELRLGQAV